MSYNYCFAYFVSVLIQREIFATSRAEVCGKEENKYAHFSLSLTRSPDENGFQAIRPELNTYFEYHFE